MTVEEVSICLMYLISFIISIDDARDSGNQFGSAIIWIISIILFLSFLVAFICDLCLLILGMFIGVSEVRLSKDLTDLENLQVSENSALARKV